MDTFDNVFVHPSAVLIGLVQLGPRSSVWPNTVIRADKNRVQIGAGVNIQDNSTLHVDSKQGIVIGDYTLVGHRTVLHSCRIGKACMIGMGSMVLEGAEIGDGAMITAGCLIRGNARIPPRALVVNKGGEIVVRENKARPLMTITGSLEYIELAQRFQKNVWGPLAPEVIAHINSAAKDLYKELFHETK